MPKLLPGWFWELSPEKQAIENKLREIIKINYEKYWYFNISTPAVELNSVLTAKWGSEVSKQIFWLYGLKQWADDLKNYSLRFDLTVPMTRYVVDNEETLKFPFKRYQMQTVWRWERQQAWRFKEFTQCDIDVVWVNLPINYDIEIIRALYDSLKEVTSFLEIENSIEVHINNRKFIDAICERFSLFEDKKQWFFRLLDDFYKISKEEFEWKLKELTWKSEEILKILNTSLDDLEIDDENISSSLEELKQVYNSLRNSWVNVIYDPYITRWLDYYTWTVFETFLSWFSEFWSICSWWRYDNLVTDIRKVANNWKESAWARKLMWVWGSIWLSRLFARFEEAWFIKKEIPLTDVVILCVPWNNSKYIENIANILRQNSIKTDVYYIDDKLQKQFQYAESKKAKYWIFAWEEEEKNGKVSIKVFENGEKVDVLVKDLVEFLRK